MSESTLDQIHHVAIQVQDIQRAIEWYQSHFTLEVTWQDQTWALIQFSNVALALVLPNQHPPHIAFSIDHADQLGALTTHRDGTRSIYIYDSEGNVVECLDKKSV